MNILTFFYTYSFFGNSLWAYIIAFIFFCVTIFALKIFQAVVLIRLKHLATKTKTNLDDLFIQILNGLGVPVFILIGLYVGFRFLVLLEIINRIIVFLLLLVLVYEILRALDRFSVFLLKQYSHKHDDGKENASFVQAGRLFSRIVFWSLGFLFVLSNLNINVSSLIASLGIGGIAVALAVQSILSDIFSSFSIYIDRPFAVGDFITIGDNSGTVKKIGLKSTRLSTLRGEELIISNKELTTARVQNFKRLQKRREVTTLNVVYELSEETLSQIPELIEEVVSNIDKAQFERCHLSVFGPYSIDFELAYLIDSADYVVYMDTKQKVNLAIFTIFKKNKINFAYPTNLEYQKRI